jgi:ABC-type sulfate/molybdate transport systems ATPase subunit
VADLVLRELTLARGGRTVLAESTIEFPGGTRSVLWGQSGTGKSTLLLAIAGLVTPASGEIALDGRVLFSASRGIDVPPHQRRIGFVFQDLALWPHLDALAQVTLVAKAGGGGRADAKRHLEAVGIGALARRRPGELSGGEQQRLAIARALASAPDVLLLDEPFSSVDPATRRSLRALLREISPRVAGPTIYVTHDPGDAHELAERVVRLHDGSLETLAGTAELDV